MRKVTMQKFSALLYTAFFFGSLSTGALASNFATVPGLRSISIYASPDVQENNNAVFYANNIELEPVKITLCYANGYKTSATTQQLSYFYSLGSGGAGAATSMPALNSNTTDGSQIYLYDQNSKYYKYYHATGMITTGGIFHSTQKLFLQSYVYIAKHTQNKTTVICNGGYPGQTLYIYLRTSKIHPFNVQIMAKNETGTVIRSSPDDVNFSTKAPRIYTIKNFVFGGYKEKHTFPFIRGNAKSVYKHSRGREYVFLPKARTAHLVADANVTIAQHNLSNSGLLDSDQIRRGLELYKITLPNAHKHALVSPLFYTQLSLGTVGEPLSNLKSYALYYNKISLSTENPPIEVAYGDQFKAYGLRIGAKKTCETYKTIRDLKNRFSPLGVISYTIADPHKKNIYYSVKGNSGYFLKSGNFAPIHENAFSLVIAFEHDKLKGHSRWCQYQQGMTLDGFDKYGNSFSLRYTPKMGTSLGGPVSTH